MGIFHGLGRAVFVVTVGEVSVGSVTISPLGNGRLSLNTTRGQAVPVIAPGSVVRIFAPDGALVLVGQF